MLDPVIRNLRKKSVLSADRKLLVIDDLGTLVADSVDRLVLVLHTLSCLDHLDVVVERIDADLAALSKEPTWGLGVTRHAFALMPHDPQLINHSTVLNTLVLA